MIIKLREASKSMAMWVVLGVLALGFGLSFGLPSDAITLGSKPIAKVYGEPIAGTDFAYQEAAIKLSPMVQIPKNDPRMQELMGVKEETVEAIIERRVLAKVAEEMGLHARLQDAEDLTFRGHLIVMGDTFDWLGGQKFNYDQVFKRWLLRTLRVSERDYLEIQRQELLARTVRDVVTSSVVIPEPELRQAYDEEANQMSLRYVRFQAAHYADLVDPEPDEIDAYVSGHKDELKQQYTSQGVRFSKLPKQVRLRFIQVKRPAPAADDAEDTVKAEVAEKDAQAKTRIEAAVTALGEGKDFRQVAREFSEDPSTARRGGDYDWVSLEGTGSGLEGIVDETAKSLEPGQTSEVVAGTEAYYIVRVDGLREGDVAEADALRELAVDAMMRDGGKTLAKQAADEALLKLKE
ncbi:MAG: peptidylprolyl isomerase, partial [Nannocystaceae bacterium]